MQTPTPTIKERAATDDGHLRLMQTLMDAGERWQDALWVVNSLLEDGYELVTEPTQDEEVA